ncbi:MAG: recombination regulator RecX [Xanthomonadaceae bacterium]|nr:recombination regulator RecX [Xanthomonadaceae bacterium]
MQEENGSTSPRSRKSRSSSEQTPVQRALGMLVRREHSRKELARKLNARGIDAEAADAAIERLSNAGLQDDGRFAESLTRTRANAGYGPVRIRVELATHGLEPGVIDAVLAEFAGEWIERARHLLTRRFDRKRLAELSIKRKAMGLLIRRGFDGDTIRTVLDVESGD